MDINKYFNPQMCNTYAWVPWHWYMYGVQSLIRNPKLVEAK